MKKIVIIISLGTLLLSCGENSEKKKGFEYNRTQKTEKKDNQSIDSSVSVDLSNKGIGPITSLTLEKRIDNKMAETGATLFKQKCTACHLADKKLIGPPMVGILERRSPEWIMNIMLNPTEMLEKDPIAKELLKAYNNVIMLNQNLSKEEARSLLEYFRTLE